MYAYSALRELHLEPSSRCQAACPMCGRNDSGGRTRPDLNETEIRIDDFRAWFPPAFLAGLETLLMCGNFGDPILARDCIPMLAHARHHNPGGTLCVVTNGSARSRDFWRDLAQLGVVVRFGIDGVTQASHGRHRRHTDLYRILDNAADFIGAGGKAVWVMLVFGHNEDEVEEAEEVARQLGFHSFQRKASTRLDARGAVVKDLEGAAVDVLMPSARFAPRADPARRPSPAMLDTCAIDCRVEASRSIYVSSEGFVLPCCWLAHDFAAYATRRPGAGTELASYFALLDAIGSENICLRHAALEDIVERQFPRIEAAWQPGAARLRTCARVCGQHGRQLFPAQFLDRTAFDRKETPAAGGP